LYVNRFAPGGETKGSGKLVVAATAHNASPTLYGKHYLIRSNNIIQQQKPIALYMHNIVIIISPKGSPLDEGFS